MPRNYKSWRERELSDAAHRGDTAKIKKLMDDDPKIRRMMKRTKGYTGVGLTTDYGLVRNAGSAYNARAARQSKERQAAAAQAKTPDAPRPPSAEELERRRRIEAVAAERKALGLSDKEYVAKFVAPLVDRVIETDANGDAKRAALLREVAEHGFKNGDDSFKVQKNLEMGDERFERELETYLMFNAFKYEGHTIGTAVIEPAMGRAYKHVIQAGLAENDVGAAQLFTDVPSIPAMPHNDFDEANRRLYASVRTNAGRSVTQDAILGKIKALADNISADPAAHEVRMKASAEKIADDRKGAERIRAMVQEEVERAVEKGWLPSADIAGDVMSGRVTGSRDVSTLLSDAHYAGYNKIRPDGSIDRRYGHKYERVMEEPETFRNGVRDILVKANGRIADVAGTARAFEKESGVQDDYAASIGEKQTRIEQLNEGGFLGRLTSHFERATLQKEIKALRERAAEHKADVIGPLRERFDKSTAELPPSLRSAAYQGPASLLAVTRNVVRAPVTP